MNEPLLWDDAMVVAAVRAGDLNAFTAIVEKYQARLARYLLRLVGDEETALDLAQDTFLEAYRGIGSLRSDLALRAWLFRIATNHAIQLRRRRKIIQWLPFPLSGSHALAHHTEPSSDSTYGERDLVGQALRSLPRDRAACLVLYHHEGFTYDEIAGILGINAEATRKRICRARDQFKESYLQLQREDGP